MDTQDWPRRIAQAAVISFLLSTPLFIAAAMEASRTPQQAFLLQEKLGWILTFPTGILIFPWGLVLGLILQQPFSDSPPWAQGIVTCFEVSSPPESTF